MRQGTVHLLWIAALLGAGWGADGQAGPKEDAAAFAARQDAAARAQWKKIFGADPVPAHQTARLLLYGTVPSKTLKDVGAALEKQLGLAQKALKMDKAPWPGKVTVYLVAKRPQFVALIRGIERRNPEPEETGSADLRRDEPHVIAGPPRAKLDPSIDNEAGQRLAAALLAQKAGPDVPEWVSEGFGRATVLLAGPVRDLAAEHRKARLLLESGKRRVQELWEGDLAAEEAGPLGETLIEYLAYSTRFKRFDRFLEGFRVEENRPNPTTLDALKYANVEPERLNAMWQKWVLTSR
jgi:hypothetical protein